MKCAAVVRKPHIREASSNAKPNLAYTTGIVPRSTESKERGGSDLLGKFVMEELRWLLRVWEVELGRKKGEWDCVSKPFTVPSALHSGVTECRGTYGSRRDFHVRGPFYGKLQHRQRQKEGDRWGASLFSAVAL